MDLQTPLSDCYPLNNESINANPIGVEWQLIRFEHLVGAADLSVTCEFGPALMIGVRLP
jgi:hypothetical protein